MGPDTMFTGVLVFAGLIVIAIVGTIAIRSHTISWSVIAGLGIGAFLVVSPLIRSLEATTTGVKIQTVVNETLNAADNNTKALEELQAAIETIQTQVAALAQQQTKVANELNAAPQSGSNPRIDLQPLTSIITQQNTLSEKLRQSQQSLSAARTSTMRANQAIREINPSPVP
jgi:outer membrane murein-binding lipoprotein Lpp